MGNGTIDFGIVSPNNGDINVSSSNLGNFCLPLPPKEKQKEIATHVYTLRQKADFLQQEGKHFFEEVMQEVGRMILNRE